MTSRVKYTTLVSGDGPERESGSPAVGLPPGVGSLSVGELVGGRFRVERLAESGGMGDVYTAIDLLTERQVALKTLRAGAGSVERFAREAQCLERVKHPGLPRFVLRGKLPTGHPFLAMEWLEGTPLEERLRSHRPSIREAVAVIRLIADAVAAAHAVDIVHRDLNPSNILVEGEALERIHVLDFGVASLPGDQPGLTRTGSQLGTPGYMAPEQVESASDASAATDVFALGCILYEMLTGERAFYAPTIRGVLVRILRDDPPSPRDFDRNIPLDLAELTLDLLAKDPTARPQNAEEVVARIDDLEELPESVPLTEPRQPQPATGGEQGIFSLILLRDEADLLERAQLSVEKQGLTAFRSEDGHVAVRTRGTGTASDHAAMAARVALALQKSTRATGIAVSTGLMRLGGAEAHERAHDSALANLLATEETRPRGSTIVLDENTATLLDARYDVRQSTGGYLLFGLRETYEPSRTILGRKTRCVGRKRELSMLEATLEECVDDSLATALIVTGPPGIGKTRLAYELTRRARRSREVVQILRGGGDAMNAGSPYSSLIRALERTCRIDEDDSPTVRRSKLQNRLLKVVPESDSARVVDFLGDLVGAQDAPHARQRLQAARRDAVLRGDQVRQAVEDWLRAECNRHPVLLILDDFHLGDLATVNLLDAALRNLAEHPLFIVALGRPELSQLFPALWVKRGVTELRLSGMSRRAGEEMIHEIVGEGVSDQVTQRVLDRAQGNPFWIEELLRAEEAGEGEDVPDRVLLLAQSRIAQLPVDARKVLRTCSVFGRRFWSGAARRLAANNMASRPFSAIKRDLIEAEMLLERDLSRFDGEEELEFASGLLRDAAYSMLSQDEREAAHSQAAEWLEQIGDTEALPIAMHFTLGGELERARSFYLRAAEQSLAGNDLEGAVSSAEEGLSAGARGPDGVSLRLVLAEASKWRGDNAAAFRAAHSALSRAQEQSVGWFRAAGEAVESGSKCGKTEECVAIAKEVLVAAGESSGLESSMACCRIAAQLVPLGKLSLAQELLELVGAQEDRLQPDPVVAGFLCKTKAAIAEASGDPLARLDHAERAADHFEDGGDLRQACASRIILGEALLDFGQHESAVDALETALLMAERLGLDTLMPLARMHLGRAHGSVGDIEEGLQLVLDAADTFDRQRDVRMAGSARLYAAEIHLSSGELELAEDSARRAGAVLRRISPLRRSAQALLALILLEAGETSEAVALAKEANDGPVSPGRLPTHDSLLKLALAEALLATGEHDRGLHLLSREAERLAEHAADMSPADAAVYLRGSPVRRRVLSLASDDPGGSPADSRQSFSGSIRISEAAPIQDEPGVGERALQIDLDEVDEATPGDLSLLALTRLHFRVAERSRSSIDNQAILWPQLAAWAALASAQAVAKGEHFPRLLASGAESGSPVDPRTLRGGILESLGLSSVLRVATRQVLSDVLGELMSERLRIEKRIALAFLRFGDLLKGDPSSTELERFLSAVAGQSTLPAALRTALVNALQRLADASDAETEAARSELVRAANRELIQAEQDHLATRLGEPERQLKQRLRERVAASFPPLLRRIATAVTFALGRPQLKHFCELWLQGRGTFAREMVLPGRGAFHSEAELERVPTQPLPLAPASKTKNDAPEPLGLDALLEPTVTEHLAAFPLGEEESTRPIQQLRRRLLATA